MSDLWRDIEEEDEVRRLVSRVDRDLETPPFAALRARPSGFGGAATPALAGAIVVAFLVVVVAQGALRPAQPGSGPLSTAIPLPTGGPQQTAGPIVMPPGYAPPALTPCADIPEPSYLPRASATNFGSERGTSSLDEVSYTVRDLRLGGSPAALRVTARSASERIFWGGPPPQPTRAGEREVSVGTSTGNALPTPPPGPSPFPTRVVALATWSEPDAACPYFTATLWLASTDTQLARSELLRIVASIAPSPRASAPQTGTGLPEADAWSRIKALFPSGPFAVPTWLPDDVDRTRVDLRKLAVTPAREYEVVYRDRAGAEILTFRLGPVDDIKGSGVGFCCVRNARATLTFDSGLFNDPARPGARQVRWEEQTRTFSFRSDRIRGEDMLRIAWSLDRATAARNHYAEARTKPDACASTRAPEDTVLRYLALAGSRDRSAVLDCHAIDRILVDDISALWSWADMPTTVNAGVSGRTDVGGRVELLVTWDFTTDPGGPWGQRRVSRFFLLGQEDGRWRIYDGGSGPFGRPP